MTKENQEYQPQGVEESNWIYISAKFTGKLLRKNVIEQSLMGSCYTDPSAKDFIAGNGRQRGNDRVMSQKRSVSNEARIAESIFTVSYG